MHRRSLVTVAAVGISTGTYKHVNERSDGGLYISNKQISRSNKISDGDSRLIKVYAEHKSLGSLNSIRNCMAVPGTVIFHFV